MPFAAECRPEIRMQRLDRDVALVREIVREVHGGHTAGAQLAGRTIPVNDSGQRR